MGRRGSTRRRGAWRWGLRLGVVLLIAVVAGLASLADDPATPGAIPATPSTATTAPPNGSGTTATPPTTTTTAAPPATTTAPETPTTAAGVTGALVDTLVVAEPAPDLPPYRRDEFAGDWAYDPATGCNTRERVLIEEAVVAPTVDDRCRSTDGRWRSAYDGLEVTDVAELEIDHLVPLAEAWRSGAARWDPERRAAFHDDLTHPETLIAVTSRTNRSKSDSRPDRWLPPDRTAWCAYATDWVAVKAAWGLSVAPAEKATLVSVLSGC